MVHNAQVSTQQNTSERDRQTETERETLREIVNQDYSVNFLKRIGVLSGKCFCNKICSLQLQVLLKVLSEEQFSSALWLCLFIWH